MSDDRTLIIRRVFEAPRPLVFAAWTDPNQAGQWWGPKGFTTISNEMDVRVDGTWQRSMRSPEGTEHRSFGVYREISEPERLVFTFAWEQGGSPGHGPETIVTVTFAERAECSSLRLLGSASQRCRSNWLFYGLADLPRCQP